MKNVLDDLLLARKYADEMHLFGDEALLANAIRQIQHVAHLDIDVILKHYEVQASNAQKGEGETLDPIPAVPQRRGAEEPIQGTFAMPPMPGEPLDSLRNPLRVSSHAPSNSEDMPDPARRARADQLVGNLTPDPDAEKENDIDPDQTRKDALAWGANLRADREKAAQDNKDKVDREHDERQKAEQEKGGQPTKQAQPQQAEERWNPDRASAALERDKTRAMDKDARWNEGA